MRLTRDDTFKVVVNLRTPNGNGNEDVGTGMFIVKNSNEPYLLTASHVAQGCNSNTVIVISNALGSSQTIALTQLSPSLNWRHHASADICVLPLSINQQFLPILQGRFFPAEQLNLSSNLPSRDTYLTAVGFPHGLGAVGRFSPFTFRSHASSALITLNRFDTNTPSDFFTLENPSIGGYSGGPIFDLGYVIVGAMTTQTGPTICHGIMHGTISDNTGGKLAAVTPCSYVASLI